MFVPNKAQWRVIWIVAVVVVLGWPADNGRSLAIKATNWLADPTNSLPKMPTQLPIGLDDNGDAVAAHDAEEAEYYRAYTSSRTTRIRMSLKTASDPFEASTERQILAGVAVFGALLVWRLNRL
ncbi:MAG TPA: hypothetical protein VKY31_05665 [Terriglobia bacterium]|nr:hypothetical protein [Terriglobia bacterium]